MSRVECEELAESAVELEQLECWTPATQAGVFLDLFENNGRDDELEQGPVGCWRAPDAVGHVGGKGRRDGQQQVGHGDTEGSMTLALRSTVFAVDGRAVQERRPAAVCLPSFRRPPSTQAACAL